MSKRSIAALFTAGVVVGAALIAPAGAHVGGTVGHLWKKHIRPEVKKQFFTKKQSNNRFLRQDAKAADSELLDGLDSTAFQRGTHNVFRRTLANNASPANLFNITGLGRIELTCPGNLPKAVFISNTSWHEGYVDLGLSDPGVAHDIGDGDSLSPVTQNPDHHAYRLSWSGFGVTRAVDIDIYMSTVDNVCRFSATMTDHTSGGILVPLLPRAQGG